MQSSAGLRMLLAAAGLGFSSLLAAAPQADSAARSPGEPALVSAERDMAQWIERVRGAPCNRSYAGTFVVLSATGAMSSARIWHACDGQRQMERVDALSGTPRTVFRRNGEVRTFLPQSRTVRTDRREESGRFPRAPVPSGTSIARFYAPRLVGQERVAGLVADVVWFRPLDALRFGYRLWSERDTGLLVKRQTLGADGQILEQAAFSELDLNALVRVDQMARSMDAIAGYQVVAPTAAVPTTAEAEGWTLRQPVAGFVPVSCRRHTVSATDAAQTALQCLYSDGLASVSLFLESFDPQQHPAQPQVFSRGATQFLAQRVLPDAWVTAVGEVPLQTLRLFVGQLERAR
nr:MucB/RseB C-terminal domain-containing protein [Verminephrobacter aporrectodeae]